MKIDYVICFGKYCATINHLGGPNKGFVAMVFADRTGRIAPNESIVRSVQNGDYEYISKGEYLAHHILRS